MKRSRFIFLVSLSLILGASGARAEDLKTFCSQTCALWPKLCASATVCKTLCATPHRIVKNCQINKVPVDTQLPDVPYPKVPFCQHICAHEALRCSVATYCIQTCKTSPQIIKQCLESGHPVDRQRPQLQG